MDNTQKIIEEKAKLYDEAVERAKIYYSTTDSAADAEVIELIFPELRESEDEKVRKELIDFVKSRLAGFPNCKRFTDWLEKQEEHKPAVKPKFEVGNWIIDSRGDTLHIISIEDDYYVVESPYIRVFNFDRASVDLSCHPWTIRYAEPGDVLVAENGWTCIFRKLEQKTFHSYCFMDSTHNFYSVGSEHTLDDRICGKMYPATKEQRDLFFSKMRENGYEWDSKHFKLTK